jgi:hypothetical protein
MQRLYEDVSMPEPSILLCAEAQEVARETEPGNGRYRLTVFLSAFLLFWIQLLIAKYILPWFGGAPAVWTTCLLFFQVLLLGGYAYAHFLSTRYALRLQSLFHTALMGGSVLLIAVLMVLWNSAVTPGTSWKPHDVNHPVWGIVTILAVSVGVPYFVLSSTGPLLQSWFRHSHPAESPYRLYALSNLGSLLALLSYPVVVEPWLSLKMQGRLWSWTYIAFALACAYCALQVAQTKPSEVTSHLGNDIEYPNASGTPDAERPSMWTYVLWVALPALASIMLLATTNQVCQDVAVVPFLWVLPLSLYLLSFILCFGKTAWYSRRLFHPAFAAAIFLACFVLYEGALGRILVQVAIYSLVLFICCMVCHGELVRLKPSPRYLTSFYLMVASGGAAGGVFVALVAPHLFRGLWEYQLGLWGSAALALAILVRDKSSWLYRSRLGSPLFIVSGAVLLPECVAIATRGSVKLADLVFLAVLVMIPSFLTGMPPAGSDKARERATPVYCAVALLILGGVFLLGTRAQLRHSVMVSRNFYGMLVVREVSPVEPGQHAYALNHGRIIHGVQFRSESMRHVPTSYYEPGSGVGLALLHHPRRLASSPGERTLRIGVVGLGIGTLAAYGQRGDYMRFYEPNPEVIRIATDSGYFTYLKDSLARVDVIPGDARLSMESELRTNNAQELDLLAIDAFTGDAVPVHLLTEEAFEIYLKHLRSPGGILALHITNGHLDLRPVIFKTAEHLGLESVWVHSKGNSITGGGSDWMLLSNDRKLLHTITNDAPSENAPVALARLWTDDYSNLFQALKR